MDGQSPLASDGRCWYIFGGSLATSLFNSFRRFRWRPFELRDLWSLNFSYFFNQAFVLISLTVPHLPSLCTSSPRRREGRAQSRHSAPLPSLPSPCIASFPKMSNQPTRWDLPCGTLSWTGPFQHAPRGACEGFLTSPPGKSCGLPSLSHLHTTRLQLASLSVQVFDSMMPLLIFKSLSVFFEIFLADLFRQHYFC